MAKEVVTQIKLQIPAGQASPAPPIGPALGQHGLNIMDFCKQFNAKTQKQAGEITPVVISVYKDRSFDFVLKTPPVSYLIKQAAKLKKGSGVPNRDKVGALTREQVLEIARKKMVDLNCYDEEAAMKIIMGTARSMGVDIKD
ncbi:MAG: 50S ribosomal protein L11 [Candidatus Dadabacteria bacterium]|nr:MAG: 50S ribosomal protein L11 [Candidatus Dadabacteria bacterium]